MGMKKAWIYNSPPPPGEFDYSSLSKSRRGEWLNSLSRGSDDILYTISAYGEIQADEMDVLHTSAAAHTASIKKKRVKGKNSGKKGRSSKPLSPTEEKMKKEMEVKMEAEKAQTPSKMDAPKNSNQSPISASPASPTSPIVINTVDDLLRILAERGLGSMPPSPAPSTTFSDIGDSDAVSETSTAVNTPVDSDFTKEKSIDSESSEAEEDTAKCMRKKLDLPADDKTVRDVKSLISYFSAPRQKLVPATTVRRGHRDAAIALDRARHASLKRFLAYHELREKERRDEESGSEEEDKASSGLGPAQWATVGPTFDGKSAKESASAILKESIKLNKPPARVRKPIPTWF